MKKIGTILVVLCGYGWVMLWAQEKKDGKKETPIEVSEGDRKKLSDEQWKRAEEGIRKARRTVVRLDLRSGTGSGIVIKHKDAYYFVSVAHNFSAGLIKKIAMPGSSPDPEEFEYKITKVAVGSAGSQKEDVAAFKVEGARADTAYAEVNESPSLSNGDPVLVMSFPLGRGLKGKEGFPVLDIGFVTGISDVISVKSVYISHKAGVADGDKVTVGPGSSGGGLFDLDGKLIGIIREVSGNKAGGVVTCVPVSNALQLIK